MANQITARGLLNRVITIEERDDDALDEHGQPSGQWISWRTDYPAKIETLSGRQLELARRIWEEASIRVTMDYVAGLNQHRHRFRLGDSTLHIGFVEDVDLEGITHVVLCARRQ